MTAAELRERWAAVQAFTRAKLGDLGGDMEIALYLHDAPAATVQLVLDAGGERASYGPSRWAELSEDTGVHDRLCAFEQRAAAAEDATNDADEVAS